MTDYRANRAQYTDVSLTGINEEDVMDANLPSIQGTAEVEGELDPISFHACEANVKSRSGSIIVAACGGSAGRLCDS